MKINEEKVKERLAGVPQSHRSHIYDASIVLEFLVQTFMPTRYFLPAGFNPTPGTALGYKSMRTVSDGKEMTMSRLYDLYKLFREEKDYTAPVESRYIFGIIIRNLRYYKNGWEFVTWRVGTAQIWHVGPLQLRLDVPAEVRAKFAPKIEDKSVEAATVEADPVADPETEVTEEELDKAIDELVKDDPPSRFVEAAPGIEPQTNEMNEDYARGENPEGY